MGAKASSVEREVNEAIKAERKALQDAQKKNRVEMIWHKIFDSAARWSAFEQYALCEQILQGSEHPGRDYQGHVGEITFGAKTFAERKLAAGERQRAIHRAVTGSVGIHLAFPRRTTAWRLATICEYTPQMIGDLGLVENKPMYSGNEKLRRRQAISDVCDAADAAADALEEFGLLRS